jgi:site-specific DNA recombinase
MRCAIYCRFSSDHQKESSIEDQTRNCQHRATREGWTITHQYADRALSGSTADRPQYQQLLRDAKAKLFDVLLVDDCSRLSRDTIESEQVRRRMIHWGIRLIGVSDGIDTSQEGHELVHGIKGIVNQTFLKDLKAKIKRGMEGQAAKCYWQGGRVYGYRLVPEYDLIKKNCYGEPAKVGTRLEIDPEQAKWVKWIFEQYANGQSGIKIVTELNRLNVPAPGAAYKKRSYQGKPSWNYLAVHGELDRGTGLLNNQLYRGLYRWNRSYRMKDPETGTETNIWRNQTDWISTEIKELRIIDEELWERAHQRRMAVSQSVMALRASAQCKARSTGRRPKYLFSGLLSCGVCHKPFTICESSKYGCSTYRTQGVYRCSNTLRVERQVLEAMLLQPIQTSLFTQEGYELFRTTFLEELKALRQGKATEQGKTQKLLVAVEQKIANIMAAIEQGIITPTTKTMLMQAEAEQTRLRQSLNSNSPNVQRNRALPAVLPDLRLWFKQSIGNLANIGAQQVDQARGIIKDLVGGSITLKPTTTSQGQALAAILRPDYAGLARQLGHPEIILVAVTRIERVTRGYDFCREYHSV